MSDFGTMIKFKKIEGTFENSDNERIVVELKNIIESNNFPSEISRNYLSLREWESGVYCSIITEYYASEEDEELMEYAEEIDLETCYEIMNLLNPTFEGKFEISASLEYW